VAVNQEALLLPEAVLQSEAGEALDEPLLYAEREAQEALDEPLLYAEREAQEALLLSEACALAPEEPQGEGLRESDKLFEPV